MSSARHRPRSCRCDAGDRGFELLITGVSEHRAWPFRAVHLPRQIAVWVSPGTALPGRELSPNPRRLSRPPTRAACVRTHPAALRHPPRYRKDSLRCPSKILADGFLSVMDRKKELIMTSGGGEHLPGRHREPARRAPVDRPGAQLRGLPSVRRRPADPGRRRGPGLGPGARDRGVLAGRAGRAAGRAGRSAGGRRRGQPAAGRGCNRSRSAGCCRWNGPPRASS
jgi:hypothetical protein